MTTIKNLTATTLLTLISICAYSQKIISGYRTMEVPRNDPSIIGQISTNGQFSGQGISLDNIRKLRSLDKLEINDTTSFKATLNGALTKVFNANLGLTKSKILSAELKTLEVWDCIDFEKLSFTEGKQSYVISVIYAKDIDITFDKSIDASIKAELDTALSDKFSIKPDFGINKNRASVKLGKDLAIAYRLLNVVSSDGYDIPNSGIRTGNKITINECRTCKDKDIYFLDLPQFPNEKFTPELAKKHQGCFNIKIVHTGQTENGNPKQNTILFCPQCFEFTGDLKPNCNDYNPNPDLYGVNPRTLIATRIGTNKLEVFNISLTNVKANYVAKPDNNNPLSNYRIGHISSDIKLRKIRMKYKIDK